jgi:hypothetical protein
VIGKLIAGERLLAGLDLGLQLGILRIEGVQVLQRVIEIARRQQHAGHYEFFDRVGVGAWCVEHRDAAHRHCWDRDVVRSGPGAPDREQGLRNLQIVQIGGSNQDRVRIVHIRRYGEPIPGQTLEPASRDVVEDLNSIFVSHASSALRCGEVGHEVD